MNLSPTGIARKLRRNMTHVEAVLWRHLRAKHLAGIKFRRQQPIGRYIVDFVSFERKLIIELDGGQHARAAEADRLRAQYLREQGFTVMRFWNNEVVDNVDGVLNAIRSNCMGTPPLGPLPQGEGK